MNFTPAEGILFKSIRNKEFLQKQMFCKDLNCPKRNTKWNTFSYKIASSRLLDKLIGNTKFREKHLDSKFFQWGAGHSYFGPSIGTGLSYQVLATGFPKNRVGVQGCGVVRDHWVVSPVSVNSLKLSLCDMYLFIIVQISWTLGRKMV